MFENGEIAELILIKDVVNKLVKTQVFGGQLTVSSQTSATLHHLAKTLILISKCHIS